MAHELTHASDESRYVLRVNGQIASVVDYRVLDDAIAFTRTFTTPPHRGTGLAGQIVEFAVDDVEANSMRHIVPSCWYVSEWFDAHPERAELLRPRSS